MDIKKYFRFQLEYKSPEELVYVIEDIETGKVELKTCAIDFRDFPKDLCFLRPLTVGIPIFKKIDL